MKKKIGTVMEEKLIYEVKKAALDADVPLSRVLEEAVEEHLEKRKHEGGRAGIVRSTFGLIKADKESIREIMDEPGLFDA